MTAIDLSGIRRDYPAWHPWQGVTGLLYARRPKSSPPIVRRDTSLDGLRRQLAAWEADHPAQGTYG